MSSEAFCSQHMVAVFYYGLHIRLLGHLFETNVQYIFCMLVVKYGKLLATYT